MVASTSMSGDVFPLGAATRNWGPTDQVYIAVEWQQPGPQTPENEAWAELFHYSCSDGDDCDTATLNTSDDLLDPILGENLTHVSLAIQKPSLIEIQAVLRQKLQDNCDNNANTGELSAIEQGAMDLSSVMWNHVSGPNSEQPVTWNNVGTCENVGVTRARFLDGERWACYTHTVSGSDRVACNDSSNPLWWGLWTNEQHMTMSGAGKEDHPSFAFYGSSDHLVVSGTHRAGTTGVAIDVHFPDEAGDPIVQFTPTGSKIENNDTEVSGGVLTTVYVDGDGSSAKVMFQSCDTSSDDCTDPDNWTANEDVVADSTTGYHHDAQFSPDRHRRGAPVRGVAVRLGPFSEQRCLARGRGHPVRHRLVDHRGRTYCVERQRRPVHRGGPPQPRPEPAREHRPRRIDRGSGLCRPMELAERPGHRRVLVSKGILVVQLIWVLSGCASVHTPDSSRIDPTQSLTPPVPHSGGYDTGQHSTTTPVVDFVPVEPSVRVVSPPGMTIGGSNGLDILPGYGTEPALLLVGAGYDHDVLPDTGYGAPYVYTSPLPAVFLIPTTLSRGQHAFLDLWDGVSGLADGGAEPGYHFHTQDLTGDSRPEVWRGEYLLATPLLGRTQGRADAIITLSPRDGSVVLAGFDADGDGHDDILTRAGNQQLVIRYGPFAPGPLPSYADGEVADDQVTVLGVDDCATDFAVTRIPDLLGPGRDVVAHGGQTTCTFGYVMYELLQPRGLKLPTPVAQLYTRIEQTWDFDTIGDADGDGHVDFLFSRLGLGSVGWVTPGPPRPTYDANDLYGFPTAVQLPQGDWSRWSIGDLNGDGVEELVAITLRFGEVNESFWAISFSPHADPLDFDDMLPVTRGGYAIEFGQLHADLDGDGLQDVVSRLVNPKSVAAGVHPDVDPALFDTSEIVIWYGADLLAAENARREARGLEPFPKRTR